MSVFVGLPTHRGTNPRGCSVRAGKRAKSTRPHYTQPKVERPFSNCNWTHVNRPAARGRDLLAEFVQACVEAGMLPGIYVNLGMNFFLDVGSNSNPHSVVPAGRNQVGLVGGNPALCQCCRCAAAAVIFSCHGKSPCLGAACGEFVWGVGVARPPRPTAAAVARPLGGKPVQSSPVHLSFQRCCAAPALRCGKGCASTSVVRAARWANWACLPLRAQRSAGNGLFTFLTGG